MDKITLIFPENLSTGYKWGYGTSKDTLFHPREGLWMVYRDPEIFDVVGVHKVDTSFDECGDILIGGGGTKLYTIYYNPNKLDEITVTFYLHRAWESHLQGYIQSHELTLRGYSNVN